MKKFNELKSAKSIEQKIALWKDIEAKASTLSIPISPELTTNQEEYIAFLKARSAASDEMVQAAKRFAKEGGTKVVAVIVGAGHTDGIFQSLKRADWPCAVLSPVSLNSVTTVRLSDKQYQRKLDGESINLAKLFGHVNRKPEPVIQREWFQAKAELYALADRVAHGGGSNGQPPMIAGGGPGQFEPDENRRLFVHFSSDEVERKVEDGREVAVFPVVIAGIGGQGERKLWIKVALLGDDRPPKGSGKGVEEQLKEALVEMRKDEPSRDKANNRRDGLIRISRDAIMAIGNSKDDVAGVSLTTL